MNATRPALGLALAATALCLAGCSFSIGNAGPASVDSSRVEDLGEDALEEQVGYRPLIDCGDEQFALEEGESRTCVLTDPATGTQFDADVVLSDIDGDRFHVDVQVAETPIG
jgi:hypothetical protein